MCLGWYGVCFLRWRARCRENAELIRSGRSWFKCLEEHISPQFFDTAILARFEIIPNNESLSSQK